MADRKGFNGLRSMGGGAQIPLIGQGQQLDERAQIMAHISQQLRALSQGIYVRVASDMVGDGASDADDFRQAAKDSQLAARAYFEAMGVVFEPEPSEPQASGAEAQNPDVSNP